MEDSNSKLKEDISLLQERLRILGRHDSGAEKTPTSMCGETYSKQFTFVVNNDHLYPSLVESERNKLHEEVKSLRKEEDTRHELEEKTHTLESQLSSTQLLLDKESAKYQSACRQQEVCRTCRIISVTLQLKVTEVI